MLMTQEEKDKILDAAAKALENGDEKLFDKIWRQYPASPDYIMGMKKIVGSEVISSLNLNFCEVEEKYGPRWCE